MENKNLLKGVLFVAMGASFYGMLATFVKVAYDQGYTTAEVTASQFVLGIISLLIINLIMANKNNSIPKVKPKDKKRLILAGTSLGFTSLFYYLSVQYINVSIAIVLLMQTVWLSILVESILTKKFPSAKKLIAMILVLIGTAMATNLINQDVELNPKGLFWGFLAACSFTTTMFTSNSMANYLPPYKKSLYMLYGGGIIVALFVFFSQLGPYYSESLMSLYRNFSDDKTGIHPLNLKIFYTWGLFLSLFGTVLPPILLNKGFPNTGLGLGSIVASIELPVSVTMAFIVLQEQVLAIQWTGIAVIIFAIIISNINFTKS
ncbi:MULTISPECIES: EamA family transporter [Empedobacter]|uniref:EamA family transporter n=1 Tax=Empedobacter falsenii TaxID=343874 RepID=A0ABY8V887_9FLAO|nr:MULTISPECIES: EamA family transporter [Empedobacter]MCA4777516.1 EamA family transporter [Empedobacter stercoris]MDM1522769.1 EamA family transporter [Empedobacter sp. 225-1]MDM1542829.1 EamA family transporter [Empedobacter sp. 189-2]WIH97904.1 EamA family transporter [Empedobacter falsenii]